jgi:hypothetical protein
VSTQQKTETFVGSLGIDLENFSLDHAFHHEWIAAQSLLQFRQAGVVSNNRTTRIGLQAPGQ